MPEGLYHETPAEALAAWDRGEVVWSVEMGGLGPGYEQAIQVCAFEMLRDLLASGIVLPRDIPDQDAPEVKAVKQRFRDITDATVHRLDDELGGMSGAQVGAAKSICGMTMRFGWREALESARKQDPDRLIQVSRCWPNVPLTLKGPSDG